MPSGEPREYCRATANPCEIETSESDSRMFVIPPKADIAALIGGQQKSNVEELRLVGLSRRGDLGPTTAAMFENFALAAECLSDR
jgi:hypothetical protein